MFDVLQVHSTFYISNKIVFVLLNGIKALQTCTSRESVTLRKKRRSCQKWSSRDLARSFSSSPVLCVRFLGVAGTASPKQYYVR